MTMFIKCLLKVGYEMECWVGAWLVNTYVCTWHLPHRVYDPEVT